MDWDNCGCVREEEEEDEEGKMLCIVRERARRMEERGLDWSESIFLGGYLGYRCD